jgi:hypothetical protein
VQAAEDAFSRAADLKNMPDSYYRAQRDRPLLMLHLIKPSVEGAPALDAAVAYGISFPGVSNRPLRLVEYVVNTVWLRQEFRDDPDDEGLDAEH